MKKTAGLVMYAATLFGISAGVGWALRPQPPAKTDEPGPTASTPPDTNAAPPLKPGSKSGRPVADRQTPESRPKAAYEPLPVAVRPAPMSVEEIVRYGLQLKDRDAAIARREQAILTTERRQQLILTDIQGEQKEIEGLYTQARDQRKATEELLGQVTLQKQQLDEHQKKNEADRKARESQNQEQDADVQANIRDLTTVVQNMEPDRAAQVIAWSDDGKIDLCVEVLARMDTRVAAEVVNAIKDEKLTSDLLGRFPVKKRATPRVAGKR